MLITTTDSLEGRRIVEYLGLVIGDLIEAARELGADAVVGIDLDYEAVGDSLLMVSANGTAVKVG